MKPTGKIYNVTVKFKDTNEHERQYTVSRKLAGLINLAENSVQIRM